MADATADTGPSDTERSARPLERLATVGVAVEALAVALAFSGLGALALRRREQ